MCFRVEPSLTLKLERKRRNTCPYDSAVVGLTASQQTAVLAAHNDARTNAFPVPLPALTSMMWDDDLAKAAQTLANECM